MTILRLRKKWFLINNNLKETIKKKKKRKLSYLSLLFSGTPHSGEYIFSFVLCLSLLFFAQLFVRTPQTTTLPSCIFFSLRRFWSLPTVECHKTLSIVLLTVCLPDLISWIYSHLHMYNHKWFYLGHTWMMFSLLSSI